MEKELIVLAAPPSSDAYYGAYEEAICSFHIAYAKQIMLHDDVVILVDETRYDDYVAALGPHGDRHVLRAPMDDIWLRDFSPLNAAAPVMFRYSAAGQGGGRIGQKDADAVQESLAEFMEGIGMAFSQSDLINDGGNFVDDYAGNVVISRKFLRDNRLSESSGRAAIKKVTGARNVAFIEADEQGGLEHADGVVAFISENVLVINSYPDDPVYARMLYTDLKAGLPGVTIHEIITPYDGSKIYDERFGSACGLYTNMLVTPRRIYFPQFGIPEDAVALKQLHGWTDKKIVLVPSSAVCQMGGGVRCMSWQLRGSAARKLLSAAND